MGKKSKTVKPVEPESSGEEEVVEPPKSDKKRKQAEKEAKPAKADKKAAASKAAKTDAKSDKKSKKAPAKKEESEEESEEEEAEPQVEAEAEADSDDKEEEAEKDAEEEDKDDDEEEEKGEDDEESPSKKAKFDADAQGEVFVANCPLDIEDSDIHSLFDGFGVSSIKWLNDRSGNFGGKGFVKMFASNVDKAIKLNGTEIKGQEVSITLPKNSGGQGGAASGVSTTIFVGNLPFSVDEEQVKEHFKECGNITEIRWGMRDGEFKGYGHVEFDSHEAAVKACELAGSDMGGREIRVDMSEPRSGGGGRGGGRGGFGGDRGGRGGFGGRGGGGRGGRGGFGDRGGRGGRGGFGGRGGGRGGFGGDRGGRGGRGGFGGRGGRGGAAPAGKRTTF